MPLKLMFKVIKVPEMILYVPRDASGSNRKNDKLKTLTFPELTCFSFVEYDTFRS